jgi:hypothetical protein
MDLSVKLLELLKHGDVEGKKLTWNLQVNANGNKLEYREK